MGVRTPIFGIAAVALLPRKDNCVMLSVSETSPESVQKRTRNFPSPSYVKFCVSRYA